MVSHAQHRKAQAMQMLAAALINSKLGGDTPDVPHRILLLLYQMSDRPLDAAFCPSDEASELLEALESEAPIELKTLSFE